MNRGLELLNGGFPMSLRLLKEVHKVLLEEGRGSERQPGEFRTSQNWIGGTRPGNAVYVPPPQHEVMNLMGELESFLYDQKTPVLLKVALAHVQFETIHPFLDGNGRLGRLLITLLLYDRKVLSEPLLYLSLYFKTYRTVYYDLLNEVRIKGNWERWLDFFADAVIITSKQAFKTAQKLIAMKEKNRTVINRQGRSSHTADIIHDILMKNPVTTSSKLVNASGLNPTTVNNALNLLINIGIVNELTGQKRNRVYCYTEYIRIMNENINLA
jgi:Fic family protein